MEMGIVPVEQGIVPVELGDRRIQWGKGRLVVYVCDQVRPADDAATHPGRPPGSAVQPVRGRRTTASPSVPRVRASTV